MLALYFIQEGEAQRSATDAVVFFVDYPDWALPVSYVTAVVMVITLALTVLAAWRGSLGRGPVIGTALGVILLIALTAAVGGPDAVRTIIDPSN